MVEAKHTPGPWLRVDTADYAEIHAAFRPSSQAVALVGKPADADLIAAAPDLLEALQDILGPLNACSDNANVRDDIVLPVDMTMGELRKARAALSKALG